MSSFRPVHFLLILLFLSLPSVEKVSGNPTSSLPVPVKLPCQGKKIQNMQCIPGGDFIRGSEEFEPDEKPEGIVYISDFFIDIYEVTNADFNKCLEAGKCKDCLQKGTCDYIGPRYGEPYLRPKQPVVGVSWFTAKEYCEWQGKRLPTEAEWEKAARGPNGNLYPWGNETATCKNSIIMERNRKGCSRRVLYPPNLMTTKDVGSRPPGIYGLYDMAGNSWEWVQDWYAPDYAACGEECRGVDPQGPCQGQESCPGYDKKVLKGGSWWWSAEYARGSKRRAHIPQNFPEYHHFGFRCAKDAYD
ncbi:formylglycine-generating enzyme family protein [Leptospira fluminis]|uniref:Formylglycine-generating enzyme family protein n=1 Tax=Leptospira fluminis TaxID=2484979 RepID=A0A4R9GSP6_9LEPT|nr:SUMF1/EgtB/PvdO family nonheme iron enzyme [Leptospira fluminis]TGK21252.1 formylglycine-generating enzyme family protein [Leptospira fluminis]